MTEIKQFKLSSGEEIICDVVEWPDAENEEVDLVVRNVFKIVSIDQTINGDRYYTFKPWMSFQDGDEMYQLINHGHVIGEANPSEKLLDHYITAVKGTSTEESEEARKAIEKRLEDYINSLRSMVENRAAGADDSDGDPKVIKFPTGRTYH